MEQAPWISTILGAAFVSAASWLSLEFGCPSITSPGALLSAVPGFLLGQGGSPLICAPVFVIWFRWSLKEATWTIPRRSVVLLVVAFALAMWHATVSVPYGIKYCLACGSTWFDTSELESTRDAADALPGADFREAFRRLHQGAIAQTLERVYLDCPVCNVPLHSREHPHVGGVIAHACPDHGAWVERSHLLRLLDAIEKYGAVELTRRKVHASETEKRRREAERQAAIAYDRQVTARMVQQRSLYAFWF